MSRAQIILWVSLCCLAVVAGALFFWVQREPAYNGRTLSEWCSEWRKAAENDPVAKRQAEEAIRQIGTNAIPVALEWINGIEKLPSEKVVEFFQKIPWIYSHLGKSAHRQRSYAEYGIIVFAALGHQGRAGIPQLEELIRSSPNEDMRITAFVAIGAMGEVAVPHIITALNDPSDVFCHISLLMFEDRHPWSLFDFGTNAAVFLPNLINLPRTTTCRCRRWLFRQ